MAKFCEVNLFSITFFVWIILIGLTHSLKLPRLEILPVQEIQKKPVGKPLMLTCRPDVPDANLITDLRWRDNTNMTILPKVPGQAQPAMYTETLPGDQSLALIIPGLQESMAGPYYCSASYANTEILEKQVKIETYVAITWKDAPEFQYPILGSDYNVRCEVTASPPPTVDWLRNGDPIKSTGRYVVETRGLLIKKVEEADDGIYTCRAAVIQTGELVERNIRVEVQIKPQITNLSSLYEAIEGQEFSAICSAKGKPVPEYTWINRRTQQNVALADRFSVNPITGQMSISRVAEEDYGTYTCVAKNSAGVAEQNTKLDVLVVPKIYEMINITNAIDTEATFVCKASGRPPPEITFRKWGTTEEFIPGYQINDDRVVLEMSFNEERGESTGTLAISKIIRSDDGLYECLARNKGDTAYKVGHITVEYPPSFEHMKGLPPIYSWEERRANLSCLAMGIPNATIEWRWNDRLIREMYDKNLQIEEDGRGRSDLLVIPADRRYYSAFKCIATNRLGRVEHTMELREARIPEVVVQAKPKTVTATTITFEIIGPAFEVGLPLTAFSVQFKEERNPDWNTARNRTWSPDSPYIVEGLMPQTSYNFRFAARNQVGLGQWGAYKVQSTPTRSVPEPPKILHMPIQEDDGEETIITSPYADQFELRWNVPADNGEPIDYYKVNYCPGGKVNGVWNEVENLCTTRDYIEFSNFNLRDLSPDTYYRVELRAHNAIGFSTPTTFLLKSARGLDVIGVAERPQITSVAIVGIAVAGVLVLLLIVDFLCCITVNVGILAVLCRRTKRSPSDLDEETKLGSLYGWRFPITYSGSLIKVERPPSPLPLPPPIVKLDSSSPVDEDEKQPLSSNGNGSIMKHSTAEFDGRVVHSRSGDIIGKNSSV